ncbi:MAG TPA: HIT family protein [Acholeplasma sp.]|nr:HIT family protein [Acholeplasma sp.]
MKTIFSQIIDREIPSSIVYEDDLVIAFLDITQATPGHTLVVTKKPYENIFEVPEETLKHLFSVVQKLSKAIFKAFDAKGINLLNNNMAAAGQTVFHYHVHIIPRFEQGDFSFHFVNHMAELSKDDYKKRAEAIIAALS